jgi:hypothetical protein
MCMTLRHVSRDTCHVRYDDVTPGGTSHRERQVETGQLLELQQPLARYLDTGHTAPWQRIAYADDYMERS